MNAWAGDPAKDLVLPNETGSKEFLQKVSISEKQVNN
jgi:hypothetical protein